MNSSVVTKNTGDQLSAAEVNNIVAAVNSKADATDTVSNQNVQQVLADGASIAWNFSIGNLATVTIAGNRSLSLTNTPVGCIGALLLKQDATGGRALTLPSNSLKQNGFALSTAAGAIDLLVFLYDGTNYYWSITNNYGSGSDVMLTDLVFQTVNNIQFNNAGNYWEQNGTANASWGNTGLSNQYLPANTDGFVQFYIADNTNNSAMIAFSVADTLTGYASFNVATWVGLDISGGLMHPSVIDGTGNIKDYTSGLNTPAVPVGSYVRLKRTAGVFTYETSADGLAWTIQYTYSYSSNAAMYVGTDINGTGRLNQPKYAGLV